jgi:hypothetical protein
MDNRTSHLLPLGYHRLHLLECLGGDIPHVSGYFNPVQGPDIFEAFRHYVARMSDTWVNEADPLSISLLAAARLVTGDLDAAEIIIDHLPGKAFKLDHGAGYCIVMPQTVLKTSLPLPVELTEIGHWIANSKDQAALRTWLKNNRERLSWCEKAGVYQMLQ